MQNFSKYKSNILSFWFSDRVRPLWYLKDDDFDEELRIKFLDIYNDGLSLPDDQKLEDVELLLSFVILFDQFPRNMFRGKARAFATDYKALKLSKYSIQNKLDENISNKEHKQFLYMPLMHSENLDDQDLSLKKFYDLGEESYKFAVMHKDVITRFGRFPGRNKALGRESSKEELDFLKEFSYF